MIEPLTEGECLLNIASVVDTIQQAETISTNDPDTLMTYLSTIITLQALITETHASVRYHLLSEKEQVLNDILKAEMYGIKTDKTKTVIKVAPSIQKIFSECRAKDWEYLYAKTDRLCANVSHTIEAVRSMLSNAKQEKYFSQYNKTP